MFVSLARQSALQKVPYVLLNPYRSKTVWPPDFSKLNPKQQFRYERKFKRRSKLKWANPGWVKGVKVAQFCSIVFVLIYGVLFMDLSNEGSPRHRPFAGIRSWFFGSMDDLFKFENVKKSNSVGQEADQTFSKTNK